MELKDSEKQVIGNADVMANYNLQCINCSGYSKNVNLIAHRNKEKFITGFIVVCEDCVTSFDDSNKSIKMLVEEIEVKK